MLTISLTVAGILRHTLIAYVPSCAGLFTCVSLRQYLEEDSWEGEVKLQQRVFDQLEKQSKWDAGDEVDEEDEELRPFPMADEATAAAHGMDPTLLEEARSAMAAFMKEDDS